MNATPSSTIVVVGAGVFGVTAALELRRRGHTVCLVDAGCVPHPDASSTDISKAVRMDYGSDGFYSDLARRSLEGWREWNRHVDDPLFHEVGVLLLGGEPFERGGFEADCFSLLVGRGVPLERIGGDRLPARFPAWSGKRFPDGYFNPQGGYVESGRAVSRLKREAVAAGVELREQARCVGLAEDDARVTGVALDGGAVLDAEHVVVSAGAWTPLLLPHLSEFMWPTGQPVLHFRPPDPRPFEGGSFPVWCADIARSGRYGFPLSRDGLVKLGHHGPGRPYSPGDALRITEQEHRLVVEHAVDHFPDLAGAAVVSSRLCLYCDTWDGNFLIDHDPERPGLVVACGGSGHGFKFAPLLGGIIADVLERRPNADAARLAWRPPGERRSEQARQSLPS